MRNSAKTGGKEDRRNTGSGGGRLRRTIVSLVAMVVFGILLTVLNVVTTRNDVALATGPESPAQHAWLVAAADRPDIAQFFKKLTHEGRVAMAQAIGRYDDAPLAKLCGLLLADFDAEARGRLVEDLKRIAAAHPAEVAEQLKNKGSFQTLGVSEALRTTGDRALPGVVAMLANGDARPAAVAYLVSAGSPAIAPLVDKLDDPSNDVRLAAADALGGLRARAAVPGLLKDLDAAQPQDRPAYLTALGAVGDPSTEGLLTGILQDPNRPVAERASVTLGLGRIGSPGAQTVLWRYAASEDPDIASGAKAALVEIGPGVLAEASVPEPLRLEIAAKVQGPAAEAVIRRSLGDPARRLTAVRAAVRRSALTGDLVGLLPAAEGDGDLAEALVAALSQTPEGRTALEARRDDRNLAGFMARQAQIESGASQG